MNLQFIINSTHQNQFRVKCMTDYTLSVISVMVLHIVLRTEQD